MAITKEWTPQERIETSRQIAYTMNMEARRIIMSRRAFELSELIVMVLSMPASFLIANADKFKEFTK